MKTLDRASLRIVHIDNEPDFARLVRTFLERAGFSHSIAHYVNGRSALEDFRKDGGIFCPHAVLLDLHMPDIDGQEMLRRIRQTHSKSDLAVFMLTSSTAPQDIWNAAANGANSYLVKTHSLMSVIERLDFLIEEINAGSGQTSAPYVRAVADDAMNRKFVDSEKSYA